VPAGHTAELKQDTDFRIDAEFAALIPPLREDEATKLEASLVAETCRDAVVVWAEGDVLLDSHNRVRLCKKHRLDFSVRRLSLPDRQAAKRWVINNQLARRNLSPNQASYLRGLEYELSKRPPHRPSREKGAKTLPLNTTARLPACRARTEPASEDAESHRSVRSACSTAGAKGARLLCGGGART
jgi:hypothetical protein